MTVLASGTLVWVGGREESDRECIYFCRLLCISALSWTGEVSEETGVSEIIIFA